MSDKHTLWATHALRLASLPPEIKLTTLNLTPNLFYLPRAFTYKICFSRQKKNISWARTCWSGSMPHIPTKNIRSRVESLYPHTALKIIKSRKRYGPENVDVLRFCAHVSRLDRRIMYILLAAFTNDKQIEHNIILGIRNRLESWFSL